MSESILMDKKNNKQRGTRPYGQEKQYETKKYLIPILYTFTLETLNRMFL